ncbi:MAG: hypothetical protein V3W14_12905 [Candidatus Neomarinimicrobiota bacterium]
MRVLATAILFLISVLHAQGTSITAQWSADTVQVGQPVRLRLLVQLEPGAVPHFPQLEISDPSVTLVSTKLEPMAAEYLFTFWELGWAVLPGIPVKYLLSDGTEHILQTDSLTLFVTTTLTGQEQDIREIKSMLPVILTDPRARLLRVVALVLLFGLIILIWRRRRRFPKAETGWKKIYPDRAALQELTRLRRYMFEPSLADQHYLELSRILRHYLERRYLFRALEMTTSEIQQVLSAEVEDPEIATLIGQVLELSDLVKFAGRRQDQQQWAYDLELVESIIRRTRPAFQV